MIVWCELVVLEVNQLIDFMRHSAILKLRFGIALIFEKLARVLNPDFYTLAQRPHICHNPPKATEEGL